MSETIEEIKQKTRLYARKIKKEVIPNIKNYIIRHPQALVAGIGVIVAIIIGLIVYHSSKEKLTEEAETRFEFGLGQYNRAITSTELSIDERIAMLNRALNAFNDVYNNFRSTPVAADALMYLGHVYYAMGDYNSALKKYQEYGEKYSDEYWADFAWINVAKCYEELNNLNGAMEAYKKVIDDYPDSVNAPRALFNIGKLYEIMNNLNKALEYYNKVIQRYQRQSMWAYEARKRALLLQALFSRPKK